MKRNEQTVGLGSAVAFAALMLVSLFPGKAGFEPLWQAYAVVGDSLAGAHWDGFLARSVASIVAHVVISLLVGLALAKRIHVS